MVTPSGDTGNSLLNGIIEYAGDHAVEQAVAQAVEHVDAVDAFVPCRAPKAIFSRTPKSKMSSESMSSESKECIPPSDAALGCDSPGALLDLCSSCSGFCSGDVIVYKDRVFCSYVCREAKQGSKGSKGSRPESKLRRSRSGSFGGACLS